MSGLLFGQPIPADLDPAFLLDELRRCKPEMDRVHAAAEIIATIERTGITPRLLGGLERAIADMERVAARLSGVEDKIRRIDELITLLDELEVIVRRQ